MAIPRSATFFTLTQFDESLSSCPKCLLPLLRKSIRAQQTDNATAPVFVWSICSVQSSGPAGNRRPGFSSLDIETWQQYQGKIYIKVGTGLHALKLLRGRELRVELSSQLSGRTWGLFLTGIAVLLKCLLVFFSNGEGSSDFRRSDVAREQENRYLFRRRVIFGHQQEERSVSYPSNKRLNVRTHQDPRNAYVTFNE